MKILAIDTSCDDTCIAILEIQGSKFKVRSNIISSQVKIHQKYGGIYPTLAKREHQKNLVPVLKKALKEANLLKKFPCTERKLTRPRTAVQGRLVRNQNLKKILEREETLFKKLKEFLEREQKPKIAAIAVTIGPGLEPCLWTGVNFAKALSYFWNLPIISVNHIEAHIAANFIEENSKLIKFPAVCLIVSGGHTQLILMTPVRKASLSNGARENWRYKIIGETRDDAAGECFDKTARILGLPYPGGPSIAIEAARFKIKDLRLKIKLPRPMLKSKDYDFSFSGLKTAVLYDFRKRPAFAKASAGKPKKEYIREMAKEIQQAIIDVLIQKTIAAARNYKAKTIILGGGVAANKELRKKIKEKIKSETPNSKLLIPNYNLCTDNAAMIAVAGYFNWLEGKKKNWKQIEVDANLRI